MIHTTGQVIREICEICGQNLHPKLQPINIFDHYMYPFVVIRVKDVFTRPTAWFVNPISHRALPNACFWVRQCKGTGKSTGLCSRTKPEVSATRSARRIRGGSPEAPEEQT